MVRATPEDEEEDRRMNEAITLDTGALIALERGDLRMGRVFVHARTQCIPMFAPADAVAEPAQPATTTAQAATATEPTPTNGEHKAVTPPADGGRAA